MTSLASGDITKISTFASKGYLDVRHARDMRALEVGSKNEFFERLCLQAPLEV